MVRLSLNQVGEAVRGRLADARERRAQRRREEQEELAAYVGGYQAAVERLQVTRKGILASRPPIAETLAQLRQAHPAPPGARPVQPEALPTLVLTSQQEQLLEEYAAAIGVEAAVLLRAIEDRRRLDGISAHYLGTPPGYSLSTLFPSAARAPFGDAAEVVSEQGTWPEPSSSDVIEVETTTTKEER
jgi:hypothetical protein